MGHIFRDAPAVAAIRVEGLPFYPKRQFSPDQISGLLMGMAVFRNGASRIEQEFAHVRFLAVGKAFKLYAFARRIVPSGIIFVKHILSFHPLLKDMAVR